MTRLIHARRVFRFSFGLAVSFLALTATARAEEPLHVRIDRMIAEDHVGPETPVASDATFLRRVYLDLAGRIPSAEEARRFLKDESPDKRAALVEELLDSPDYVRHMANVFDVMLMERRQDQHVEDEKWRQYLRTSFEQNKPYNRLAREILAGDGVDDEKRARAKFYLEREVESNLLTRDVGRMFFGMDLQCAQCHDHPLIGDYEQADYYGIYAFLSRSSLFKPGKKKPAVIAEKAEGTVEYESVFTGFGGETRPRLPGEAEIEEPTFPEGEAYEVKPDKDKKVRPVPKYSRREKLAELATDGSNEAFNRNIANRLWAHMMGRGLVEPVDLHHPGNPPSHPELLDLLAEEFVAMNFDIKAFLNELALTRTYQRSFDMPESLQANILEAREELSAAEAEAEKLTEIAGETQDRLNKLQTELATAEQEADALSQEAGKAREALAEAQKAADEAKKALKQGRKSLSEKRTIAQALAEASGQAQEAIKNVPDDEELAQAAQTFQQRAKTLADQVTALEKTVAERSDAAQAAEKTLAARRESVEEATAQLESAQQEVRKLADRVAAVNLKWEDERTRANAEDERIERIETLLAYDEKQKKLAESTAVRKYLESELASAREKAETTGRKTAETQNRLEEAQKEHEQAVAALEQARRQFEAKQEVAGLVAESLSKVRQAHGKLTGDSGLAEVLETLQSRSETLSKQATTAEERLAKRQEAEKRTSEQLAEARQAAQAARRAAEAAERQVKDLQAKLQEATETVESRQSAVDEARKELTKQWSAQFALASLKPLSPEQLTWSLLQATGEKARQRRAVVAELKKKAEENSDDADSDPQDEQIRQALDEKLKGRVDEFINLFGNESGQPQNEFFATVDQALFFSNGGRIRGWLNPRGGNLTDRLMKIDDPQALAEELYLSVLTRRPTEEETADVAEYLQSRSDDKKSAVRELAWALLTSTEFRFNH